MAQEVLAHLLVINISVCNICLTSQHSLYKVSPCSLSTQTFLVTGFRVFPLYRDDFRQSSTLKHDKQIVFLSITVSMIIPGVMYEGPTLLHTRFNKLIVMSGLN
jgi:hypothetical protein